MIIPAVVLVSQFVTSDKKMYKDYIDYIDRDDAKMKVSVSEKENEINIFHTYIEYMDDNEKKGELFTSEEDSLNLNEKRNLKKAFTEAQENGSPLWQDVISFDNTFLEEQGIYNRDTDVLDEGKIKSIVRNAVEEMLTRENMIESATWSASIHYDTDNIHVHIATVERVPTREKMKFFCKEDKVWKEGYRAKRKQSSLDRMKSTVANQLLDRTSDYNRIDNLIRNTVHYKKDHQIKLSQYAETKSLFIKAMERLPQDLRQWRYGYQSINDARPYIDEIVDIYLNTYHKEDMKSLNQELDKQVTLSKRLYGENSRHEQYKETKLEDLKTRMGNAVLTEMRSIVISNRRHNNKLLSNEQHRQPKQQFHYKNYAGKEIFFALMRLRYAMKKKWHDYQRERNIDEFDRMLEGRE